MRRWSGRVVSCMMDSLVRYDTVSRPEIAGMLGWQPMSMKVSALVDLFLQAAAKTENDFVFLSNNPGEIDADIRCVDAPARGVSRIVSDLRAVDHGLGGRATNVDAGATQVIVLDERYRPSQIREAIGERIAGLAGADDDGIVLHGDPPVGRRAKTIHRMPQACMKIREISQYEELRRAPVMNPPNATGFAAIALARSEKLL